jgi:light-regulated signal transduction histidine kinase (bacteriophytochrome)
MDQAATHSTLEAEVVALRAALAAATSDAQSVRRAFESLSSSIAHDLRAPLRAIDGFSRILSDEHAEELGEEGKRLLGAVRRNAQRQSALMEELLSFMALERAPLRPVELDMGKLAEEAFKREREREPQRTVDLRVEELPRVQGDELLVRKLWSALLSNALKFTRRQKHAVIEVRGERAEGSAVFQVQDNGVGFDPAYAGKLFGLFQRMHHERDFEGLGVGLATAQRIVERHQGTLRLEAAVDRGATVIFTLPA